MTTKFFGFHSCTLTGVNVTNHVLGRGSYATVLEVECKGLKCAGKKIHDILLMQGSSSYPIVRFEKECLLLSQLNHPNIVKFFGVFFQDESQAPILVMEYLPTDLTSCLKNGLFPNETNYSILHDVAKGLDYLHNQCPPIIHRDLTSNNILLTSSMTAKISDLGVAKIVDKSPLLVSRMTQTPGTPAYMPPEVMIANPSYDASVDEFSYGILMIHVLSGQWPEPRVEPNRVEGNKLVPVSEADRRREYLEMIGNSHPLMELVLRCINNNPQLRPCSSEIVNQLSKLVLKFPADHHHPKKLTVPFTGTLTRSSKSHKKSDITFPVVKGETETCSSGTLRRSKSRKAIDKLSVDKCASLQRNDSQEEGKMSHTVERQLKGLFGRKQKDFLLSKYSVIVLDEAHERSVFTDILIGLLSRIIPLREKNGNPLKLVIMSATLRVEDFTENKLLFPKPPPIISVESRQYSVTVHFNKRTPVDYLGEAYRKVCKIHRQMSTGNILVFMTGQAEVHRLCRKLRKTFPSRLKISCDSDSVGVGDSDNVKERRGVGAGKQHARKRKRETVKDINLDDYPILPNQASSILHDCEDEEGAEEFLLSSGDEESDAEGEGEGEMEENEFMEAEQRRFDARLPMLVLPLYSLLSAEQQARVFATPPEGVRLCVVATNVAETSLTIPNVKYVIDTGKVKRRYYDKITGVSTFRVTWTSKASANQRAGRAGRTEPGHCYRLYSSAVFNNEFEQFSPPEITRRPVDDLVLQMKAMGISRVINFPFPTAPTVEALNAAEKLLVRLGALKASEKDKRLQSSLSATTIKSSSPPTITPLGRTMAQFPIAPRYAKMLALGRQHGCLPYIIVIVAALSVREIFAESADVMSVEEVEGSDEEEVIAARKRQGRIASRRRAWAGQGEGLLLGDLMVLLRAIGACEFADCTQDFCRKNGLRLKAMLEIRKLRQQLTNAVNSLCPDAGVAVDPNMPPPLDKQVRCLRQIVLAGLGDHVARRISTDGMNTEDKQRLRYAYQSTLCEAPVFLHSSSVLLHAKSEFIIFQELIETSKLFMKEVTAIEGPWLPVILPENCTFSSPLELPPPWFDDATGTIKCHMTCNYGELSWPLGAQELPYPESLDKYRLFGQFLLQGKVIPKLAQFAPYLLIAPVTMMKKWSKLHKQCGVLLNALVNREVSTQSSLLEAWVKEPQYLLKAYSMWLPEEKHKILASIWPPVENLYTE